MGVTVVIPTLNESRFVGALLESLRAQALEVDYEVILVDASPGPETVDVVNRFRDVHPIKVIRSEVADVGHQRNLGAQAASHAHLLFVDADVVLGGGVIERCVSRLDQEQLGLVSVRHRPDRSSLGIHATLMVIYALIMLARFCGLPVSNGDFLFTNTRTFRRVEGFQSGYLLGEDTDFGYRAAKLGAKQLFVWRAAITASSRRLSASSERELASRWIGAYLRVIAGKGPTGSRSYDATYPYGIW